MVSSGTVIGHAEELKEAFTKYMSQVEDLDGSWKGPSHDNFISKCSEFNSESQNVFEQMNSFADAVELYEEYKNIKDKYKTMVETFNNEVRFSKNTAEKNEYKSNIEKLKKEMENLSTKIKEALSKASAFKMEATSVSGTAAPNIDGASDAKGSLNISSDGGEFINESSTGVYGYIVSSIDGKTHTVYRQSEIPGWARDCNRAAASSIASAYESYPGQAVDIAKQSSNGIGYVGDVTEAYFSNFGLNSSVRSVGGSYENIKGDIVSNLSQGNYVMFDLSQPNVVGQSGQQWTSSRHWLAVLDMKKTGPGDNDYAIFVSDSGHGGSAADYGLGAGWYSIDEFSGQQIQDFATIST